MAAVAHIGVARRLAKIDVLVEELPQSQVLSQRRRQHQSRVRHQMLVVGMSRQGGRGCGKIRAANSAFR